MKLETVRCSFILRSAIIIDVVLTGYGWLTKQEVEALK